MKKKKRKISETCVEILEEHTGLSRPEQAIAKLIVITDLANEEAADFSKRLREMQTRVELAQEDLNRRDLELQSHFADLADAIGVKLEDLTAESVVEAIRVQRSLAERMRVFRDVMDGNFDPDVELTRRVACALGTSHTDLKSILTRLTDIPQLRRENARLTRENVDVKEMEAQLDDHRVIDTLKRVLEGVPEGAFDFEDEDEELGDELQQLGLR